MKVYKRPESIPEIFERKGGAEPDATHYCPGCGHGIIHKLLGEVIDELEIRDRTILISPVGCSVFAYYYFDTGNVQSAHGRAPAVGTGIKRARPDSIVISYQGDGDLAAIGGNNVLQAANRGENLTVIFVNNAIYGMTGGQLAPTSLLGMKTATTPRGRAYEEYGSPLRMAELLSNLDGVAFSARHSLTNAARIAKTKKAIKKALTYQMEGKGFSLVEILSACPTGWKLDPVDSLTWIEENMEPVFPLNTYKDEPKEKLKGARPADYDQSLVNKILHPESNGAGAVKRRETAPWAESFGGKGADKEHIGLKAAGFGGQGILLLGEVLAKGALAEGLMATWLPSYGPEMRGGTANCSVVMSVGDVGNPMVDETDVLIAMNRPSMEKFVKEMKPDGILLYDSSLIDIEPARKDITAFPVPATQIADAIGTNRVANVVMIGAFMGVLGYPHRKAMEGILRSFSKNPKILDFNMKALQGGLEAVKDLVK